MHNKRVWSFLHFPISSIAIPPPDASDIRPPEFSANEAWLFANLLSVPYRLGKTNCNRNKDKWKNIAHVSIWQQYHINRVDCIADKKNLLTGCLQEW